MEVVLSILTVFYSHLRVNWLDSFLIILQKLIKLFLFLIQCVAQPFLLLQYFKKRKQLPPVKSKILFSSATEIAEKIRRREIRCVDVIAVYVERCKEVNPTINAIVESRFEESLQEAKAVDEFLKTTTKTEEELAREMPLLGLPITVKESIAVKGMSYSVGVKEENPKKADQDAHVVELVRNAGAIILLVSNTPELCFCWETYNSVTGRTNNPYDTNRISGGSSGGEAALLGAGASLLSLSSDIGGSGRIPAMFCGVYGHKPSPGWVPVVGHKPYSTHETWPSYFAIGSMTRYAEDLPLILKVISQPDETHRVFEEKVSLKGIRFFYAEGDDCPVSRKINDDMREAIERLRKYIETTHGVEVQKAKISEMKFAFNISSSILLRLNIECLSERVAKTQRNSFIAILKAIFFLSPHTLPFLLYKFLWWFTGLLPKKYHAKMLQKKAHLRKQFEALLGENGVLICPSFPTPAYYPFETLYNIGGFTHLMIYNVLGLPVTQCPIGLNEKGLPIGLQIVTNPGCDHLSIAVAQEIQKAFGGWRLPDSGKNV